MLRQWTGGSLPVPPCMSRWVNVADRLDPVAAAYVDAIHAWPLFREWQAAALAEPWIIAEDEVA